MKRNWSIILLILGMIMAYEAFVLRPYNQKYNLTKKENKETVLQNKSSQNTQNDALNVSKQNVQSLVKKDWAQPTQQDSKNLFYMNLEHGRKIAFFPKGGRLGKVLYSTYKERNSDKAVSTVENGFYWFSENTALSDCISRMNRTTQTQTNVRYEGSNQYLKCVAAYTKNTDNPLLLDVRLGVSVLNNFPLSGSVEFLTHDKVQIGANELDHRFLNYELDGDVEVIRGSKDLNEFQVYRGNVKWTAWGDKYFNSIFLPRGRFNPDIFHKASSVGEEFSVVGMSYPLRAAQDTPHLDFEMGAYFGIRDLDELNSVQEGLDQAVALGFFSSVARFMLWSLKKLFIIFQNYGFSIIALTLLVRILFWPLNKKVYSSGQKMKELQPKMEAIKKKYKGGDRQQMQQMNLEIMGLYKAHKVNPMGSCLPILLQMPIFLGLYGALGNSIDLYQAPFMGWIQDLSSKDPLYILPIVWTLSLLVTMQFTPQQNTQPGMPDMKWIMMIMYVFFGFFAKDWPAGLVLYLVVSNLVGIGQQFALKKSFKKVTVVQEGA